jgi:hypothetical protein
MRKKGKTMDYSKLKIELKEIAAIAAGVPDAFKKKCFEVLLNHLLQECVPSPPPRDPSGIKPPPPDTLPISTQLRVFMQRTGISEAEIKAVLMVADEEVHFVCEPSATKIVDGQIQWALLLALKNCILNNELSADPEDVRSVCQDKGFYDSSNFAGNFKKRKYATLFKGPMERQGDRQVLTPAGEGELAKLIKTLNASQQ